MVKTGWKMFYNDAGILRPAMVYNPGIGPSRHALKEHRLFSYRVGKWNHRRRGWGPYAVFCTKYCAGVLRGYLPIKGKQNRLDTYPILPVVYRPSDAVRLWCLDPIKVVDYSTLPQGTFLANSFRIIESESLKEALAYL